MSLITRKSIFLYLIAVFAAGAVAGGVTGFQLGVHKALTPPSQTEITTSVCDHLQSRLHLSADQMAHIRPIVDDSMQEFGRLCVTTGDQITALIKKTNERLAPFLTAEQKSMLEAMEREREECFRKVSQPDASK